MPDILRQGIEKFSIGSLGLINLKPAENFTSILGGSTPVMLTFSIQKQIQTQWCWAATAVSISLFYDNSSTWTQCSLAEAALNSECCQFPEPCNKPWYLHEALTITDNFIKYSDTLTFNEVEDELKNGKVIGCRIGWVGGGGHFVVLYGCKSVDGVNYFSIDDPTDGKIEVTEAAFLSAYQGSGKWTHTFITKP
ncbi:Peptidase C39 family protein [Dyadobacter koreensis]|uniref:Peptidase C39 family protein n=1 Tax=Dyadobacter koreensis TaxID=408657 RepID=A0A1H6YY32_9BACT|nr:papain-like cysteine protease family protein [Dyadobacter koreensis]SEJ41625.1 Peptidase C39 family protein [Dyadobacter koreensis]